MRTSHIAPTFFFYDLSLQWPVPGENEGDGAVGRNEEEERVRQDLKRENRVERERD